MDDKAFRLGAALAFYSVLSLGPLVLLLLSAASTLWDHTAASSQILNDVRAFVGDKGAEAVETVLKAGEEIKYHGLIPNLTNIALLLFSASAVFGELQDAMNLIWKVPPRPDRSILIYIHEQVLSFVMVIACAFFLIASMILSTGITAFNHLTPSWISKWPLLIQGIDGIASFAVTAGIFALIFKYIPSTPIQWRNVWPAALLTALLFILGKILIALYLSHSSVAANYGAAGSVVIILVWVYYSAQILFFGAEFCHAYEQAEAPNFKGHKDRGKSSLN